MKESDLYLPLKKLLESQGYEVKGEIHNCDVFAVRQDEDPVVVELKLSLNIQVLLQAVERLSITPNVYIGVPKNIGIFKKRQKQVIKLLKMLGLGLITIDPEKTAQEVQILIDPEEYKPRISKRRQQRSLGEFMKRVGDPNLGGMEKKKGVLTAYRQKALLISHYLQENGPTKASIIAKALDEPKARNILYNDVYGWFDRPFVGIYELSPRGKSEINLWKTEAESNGADC